MLQKFLVHHWSAFNIGNKGVFLYKLFFPKIFVFLVSKRGRKFLVPQTWSCGYTGHLLITKIAKLFSFF